MTVSVLAVSTAVEVSASVSMVVGVDGVAAAAVTTAVEVSASVSMVVGVDEAGVNEAAAAVVTTAVEVSGPVDGVTAAFLVFFLRCFRLGAGSGSGDEAWLAAFLSLVR